VRVKTNIKLELKAGGCCWMEINVNLASRNRCSKRAKLEVEQVVAFSISISFCFSFHNLIKSQNAFLLCNKRALPLDRPIELMAMQEILAERGQEWPIIMQFLSLSFANFGEIYAFDDGAE